jgi:hypothetical protein
MARHAAAIVDAQDWDQINIDFFSNKKDENVPLPEYRLNVLWTEKNLAVAIDQVYSRVSMQACLLCLAQPLQ